MYYEILGVTGEVGILMLESHSIMSCVPTALQTDTRLHGQPSIAGAAGHVGSWAV